MKRSNRLFILIGVFFAIIAGVGVTALASRGGGGAGASAAPTSPPNVSVVYAKVDIKMGDTITADMVGEKSMSPAAKADLGAGVYSQAGQVVGRVAGSNITKDAFIYENRDFTAPGTVKEGQSLAPGLSPGMVGMSIEVDQINGVGTLIVPGDHVDVLLSVWASQTAFKGIDISGGKYKVDFGGGTDVTSKIVFQNRKVLATLTPAPTEEAAPAANSTATPKPTDNSVRLSTDHMIVILEVKPSEAEVIRWAQRAEKMDPQNYITLGLALRSSKDNDTADVKTDGIIFRNLVEIWGVLPPDGRGTLPKDIVSKLVW